LFFPTPYVVRCVALLKAKKLIGRKHHHQSENKTYLTGCGAKAADEEASMGASRKLHGDC
jgi:hypothetical protein